MATGQEILNKYGTVGQAKAVLQSNIANSTAAAKQAVQSLSSNSPAGYTGTGSNPIAGGWLQFPINLTNRADVTQYTYFAARDKATNYNTIDETSKFLGQVYLPLPRELIATYKSTWETRDLGLLGAVQSGWSGAAGNTFKNLARKFTNGAPVLKDLILDKIIPNPYKYVQWKGPEFRTFTFTYDLVATSGLEAEKLNEIIWTFKKYVHTSSSAYEGSMRQPPLWNILFADKTNESSNAITGATQWPGNKFLFQLKDCAITSFEVDYTTKGNVFHRQGLDGQGFHAPNGVKLTFQFTETMVLTQKDYGNTYPNRVTF